MFVLSYLGVLFDVPFMLPATFAHSEAGIRVLFKLTDGRPPIMALARPRTYQHVASCISVPFHFFPFSLGLSRALRVLAQAVYGGAVLGGPVAVGWPQLEVEEMDVAWRRAGDQ